MKYYYFTSIVYRFSVVTDSMETEVRDFIDPCIALPSVDPNPITDPSDKVTTIYYESAMDFLDRMDENITPIDAGAIKRLTGGDSTFARLLGAPEAPFVTITLDYSTKSHLLHGIAIKDLYVNFRIEVLRVAEWATWHGKLTKYEGLPKGWIIRKTDYQNLIDALDKYNIPYIVNSTSEYPIKPKPAKPKKKKAPKV